MTEQDPRVRIWKPGQTLTIDRIYQDLSDRQRAEVRDFVELSIRADKAFHKVLRQTIIDSLKVVFVVGVLSGMGVALIIMFAKQLFPGG